MRRALVGLAFGVATAGAWAATNAVLPYTARVWQTDEGLPQNSVWAIAQTGDGYLWVGTQEGLARFDGVRFMLVDDPAAPELKNGWITALCAGRDGSLWVACDGKGVTRLKEGTFTHLTEAEGLPSNQTRRLLESRDGSLWIGSEGGLTHYKDGKITNYTEKNGLGDNSVRGLCEDHQGVLRVATRRGLSSLHRDGIISTFSFGPGWTRNALRFVYEDRQGNLWTGSNEGLTRLRGEERSFYSTGQGLPNPTIDTVYEDSTGQLWVGTYGGLARMVEGQVIGRPPGEWLLWDMVYTLFEDRERNLWVGARDGLYRLNPARFTTYTTQQGLTDNNVMSVCESRSGAIWIATWGGGLDELKEGRITAYGSTDGLTEEKVLSLHEGRDGSLWIGMDFNGGLNRFKGAYTNSFPKLSGLTNAPIRVVHQDRRGALWIGTSGGLKVYQNGKLGVYTRANGLAGDSVHALCEDATTNLWIGTDTGLSRWDGRRFTSFTTHEGLSHNAVDALYEDGNGTLWIGTRGGGLNRFKGGRFAVCTPRQGLFSDEVYEILEDDFGYFWMSCRTGIFRAARKELEALADGTLGAVTCISFGKADGLLTVQCNGVAKPAGWKASDGRLWFATIRGVVAVEPRIKSNALPPPVAIESVMADRKQVGSPVRKGWLTREGSPGTWPPAPVTIPPGRGELEIRYTALSLQAPEKNRFKYMLEGADTGWNDAGTERAAHYNNLAPGRYRFRVIACNNDGVWNETGATLALVLLPHFWQTWWLRSAVLVGIGGLLWLLYRVRLARLRAIESLRVQIAANLHDDVGARLTKVAMITESAERETPDSGPLKSHIQTIARTTGEIIQAMDEIVWTINPKNDTLDHLANYIFQYAQEYFQDTGVRCRLDVPAQLPERAVSTETRHNLFMAVKEALNNVLKHSEASEVRLGLALADGKLTITIADNGRGFSPGQPQRRGNGLENMQQRLKRVGGRLGLESQPGRGTRIIMEAEAR